MFHVAQQPDITTTAVGQAARQAHAHAVLQAAHEAGALRNLKRRLHAGMTAEDVRVVIDDAIGDIEARVGVAAVVS